jgi:Ni,Fe-hydrogenase maturation factor
LLAALTWLGRTPGEFVAIGIEPQNMTPSIELSSVVHDALEHAEREVITQLAAWGVAARALEVPRSTVLSL